MGTAFRMLIVVIAVGAPGAWGAAERRVMAGHGRRPAAAIRERRLSGRPAMRCPSDVAVSTECLCAN